jgi:uncharacterized membrane protein YbhN (UPF0104 family)
MDSNLYRKASEYLGSNIKSAGVLFRGFVTNAFITAFIAWVAFFMPQSGAARFIVGLYVWGLGSLIALVFLFASKLYGEKDGVQSKSTLSALDSMIWRYSWPLPLQMMYRIIDLAFDAAIVYCLYRLGTPLAAWFYAAVHVVLAYLHFYPTIQPKVRARAEKLIPAGVTVDPVQVHPLKF